MASKFQKPLSPEALQFVQSAATKSNISESPAEIAAIPDVPEAQKQAPEAPEAAKKGKGSASPAKLKKTAPAPVLAVLEAETAAPWDLADDNVKHGLHFPMPGKLHAKMVWLTNNLPKMSLQKLVKAGTEAEVERLLTLHYKGYKGDE